jgi:hypothetical protein
MDITRRTESTRYVLKTEQSRAARPMFSKAAVRWSYIKNKIKRQKGVREKKSKGTKFRNQRSRVFFLSLEKKQEWTNKRSAKRWAERGEKNQKLKNIYLQCEEGGHAHMVVEVVVGACLCLQEGSRSCSKPLPPLLSLMSSTALSPS